MIIRTIRDTMIEDPHNIMNLFVNNNETKLYEEDDICVLCLHNNKYWI